MAREPKKDLEQKAASEDLARDMPAIADESAESFVSLITPEKFQERIEQLRARTTITNDKGETIAFESEAKDAFVDAFQRGYPVIASTLDSLHKMGTFLNEVRIKLKPHKLYHTWLEYAGIPRGTAQSYVQACRRFGDDLPRFAPLGIKKILIASRLPDCVEYLKKHEKDIASLTAQELEKQVKQLRLKARKKGSGGRPATYLEIGKVIIRPSLDGTRLTIEGLTKGKQKEIIDTLNALLSQAKD
jgi:hypothetical protein